MNHFNEWAEKYRPKILEKVVGNSSAIDKLKKWAQKWDQGVPEYKAVLLYGPAGVGKTSTAYALANDMNWEVIELNASDQRTADIIGKVAGSASQMKTLDGIDSRRLIILDEADNLHGTSDRGGAKAIGHIVKSTKQPIILIANDAYGIASSIKTYVLEIKFNSLQTRSLISTLKGIANQEGINLENNALDNIATNADGDMRSAINDLQAVSLGKKEIRQQDIVVGQRDNKDSIFKVLEKIFKGNNAREALEATYGLDESPENLIHWIDENIPTQYSDKNLEKINDAIYNAYEYVARADIFLGRVKKRQNYLMWRYAGFLMTYGTVVSKSQSKNTFIKFNPPSLWRRMGQLKNKRSMKNNVAAKIAYHCNESMNYASSQLSYTYKLLIQNPQYAPEIIAVLDLELEELLFITGNTKVTKKIQNLYNEAQLIKKTYNAELISFKVAVKEDKHQKCFEEILANSNSTELIIKTENKDRKTQKTLFDF